MDQCVLVGVSSDFSFFFYCHEERLTAPSELHAVDRLGREVVVTTGSAHSRERETDFEGAGRVCRQEIAIQQSTNAKTGKKL